MRRRHGSLRAPLAGPTANPPLESGGKSKLTRPHLPIAQHLLAVQTAVDRLHELGAKEQLKLLTDRLQRLAFPATPENEEKC